MNRGNSALTLSNTFNPVMELKDSTKVIKTGPGGVPDKRSFKTQHRNVHESHKGQLGANSTTELIASSIM
jgi:DNA-directed RNA polymerase beta subunit